VSARKYKGEGAASKRSVGRRLLLQLLLVSLVLATLSPPAAAPVRSVTVAPDRTDYVLGMAVNAVAAIVIDPPYAQADERSLVEWSNETWVLERAEYVVKIQINQRDWESVASWTPPSTGLYHVNVSSNETNGTPPVISGSASFRVWDPQDFVIATGIRVDTDRGGYELGQTATATANLTADPGWVYGNLSLLERVRFDWYYPTGAPARTGVVRDVVSGEAGDAWAPDALGVDYNVTVTYLGNDSVANETRFAVFPTTVLATNVTSGQSVTWDAGTRWRVCGDLLVSPGGTLTIEAGATVRFCRGSRLLVEGALTANAAPGTPINLTSYEWPPAPGDWSGVWLRSTATVLASWLIIEHVSNGVVADGNSPVLVGLTLRSGTGEAVNFTRSTGTLQDSQISGFSRGVRAWSAAPLIENVTVTGAREGVSVGGGSLGAVFRDIRVDGGNYSVAALSSDDLLFDRVSLTGAAVRAVDLKVATATFVNATIAASAAAQDFLLVAATATLLNCTFADDAARRTIVTPSRLIVQNFLAVDVRTATNVPVPGATVSVAVGGRALPARTTDASGLAAWIVVEDRVVNATGTWKNVVSVTVSKAGFVVATSPRYVDMAVSHTERFVAEDTSFFGGSNTPWFLALLAALLLVPGIFLVWRRRRTQEEDEAPEPAKMPDLLAGRSYAVLTETSDAAFVRFAEDVRRGSPGICITRVHPEEARARWRFDGVPVYWLSRSFGKETLNPTNLGAIVELVRKEAAERPGCRVLVDGLEYLFTQNDFGKVVKFVQALADVVAERGAVLLLPINPKSFDTEDRLAILTRDLQKWP